MKSVFHLSGDQELPEMGPEVLLKVDPAGLDSETERNRGETHLKFNLSIFTKGSVFLPCGPVVVIYNN